MYGLPGIFEALILIALGTGYIVLYLAKREEKQLRFIGYIIGAAIIVLAIVYLVGNAWVQANICYPKMRHYKGIMQKRMMQPRMMPQVPAQKR